MAHDTTAAAQFDETDPHGFAKGHHGHGHVIVSPLKLRLVLVVLLFFTALTVGLAQAEIWFATTFHVVLPWWVNVAVAMSIAVVKSLMVMAIFMQLRYDNPMNSVVMAFTFVALFIFIFFTGLDLFNRARVYDWKAPQIVAGGTGQNVKRAEGQPVVVAARNRWMEKWGPEVFEQKKAEFSHGHAHADAAGNVNSASRSRPQHGLSGALSTEAAAEQAGHAAPAAPKAH